MKPISLSSVEICGIDSSDYPDFCDAYIDYAEYEDGTPLTGDELEELDEDRTFITGMVLERINDL